MKGLGLITHSLGLQSLCFFCLGIIKASGPRCRQAHIAQVWPLQWRHDRLLLAPSCLHDALVGIVIVSHTSLQPLEEVSIEKTGARLLLLDYVVGQPPRLVLGDSYKLDGKKLKKKEIFFIKKTEG